ncbi:MAG TPA: His/Gly/Thr/Pro-type tRNA ligase C-terminal domain-containing protein, partial [Nitriliruptorales bacterium]|nr:His/Gly/Thr/Pro-type tRNA ligase C-terminal domain-containing protein [Nitriliruptorales bacterium]
IRDRVATTERGKLGLAEVDDVLALVAPALATGSAVFAPLLARGLSYYTGPIFETFARGLDSAIASGGRYDRLVGVFSNRDIPATGGSIGLERVLLLGGSEGTGGHAPDAMVAVFDDDARGDALAVARRLRDAGLHADVYVGSGRLGRQLRYADRRGIRYCVLRGSDERATGTAAVKDLRTGEQSNMALDDLPGHLHRLLRTGSRP